jgi:hypothetical protein
MTRTHAHTRARRHAYAHGDMHTHTHTCIHTGSTASRAARPRGSTRTPVASRTWPPPPFPHVARPASLSLTLSHPLTLFPSRSGALSRCTRRARHSRPTPRPTSRRSPECVLLAMFQVVSHVLYCALLRTYAIPDFGFSCFVCPAPIPLRVWGVKTHVPPSRATPVQPQFPVHPPHTLLPLRHDMT